MAKFYGAVGYEIMTETEQSVYLPKIEERMYSGDILEIRSRRSSGEGVNDNLTISNKISILADPWAYQHFPQIAYVVWHGVKWKVSEISVEYPRLTLSVGEVYNGSTGPQVNS